MKEDRARMRLGEAGGCSGSLAWARAGQSVESPLSYKDLCTASETHRDGSSTPLPPPPGSSP
jgi:hypothetical protein